MANKSPNKVGLRPPWTQGKSGNPGGRPKIAKEFAKWLRDEKFSAPAERDALWKRAKKSDYLMVHLMEYAFGKAPQPLTGEEGKGPVSVRIVYEQPAS